MIVAHPRDVKAIAKAEIKTDERDSYKPTELCGGCVENGRLLIQYAIFLII